MKRNNTIRRASATLVLASAAFTLLLTSTVNPAWAAKPPKPPPPPPAYTHAYIHLGGLGGNYGYAAVVNNAGQVIGASASDAGMTHAFIIVPDDPNGDGKPEWFAAGGLPNQNALMRDLGMGAGFEGLEGQASYATDLNDAGQVLVNCYDNAWNQAPKGFVVSPADMDGDGTEEWFWSDENGANALMQPLSPGSAITITELYALGINRQGQIVGLCNERGYLINGADSDNDSIADVWYQDQNADGLNDLYLDLGAAVGLRGYLLPLQPTRINDAGQIIGRVPMDPVNTDLGDPFIITPKTDAEGNRVWNEDRNNDGINDLVIKLPLLQTGMWGNALGVNSAGVIVGWSQTKGSNPHAMMWRVDAQGAVITTDLGILQGEAQSMAAAVNDSLQIAGFARTYQMRKMSITESAFLWQNSVLSDLRDLVDQGALLEGRNMGATGINNSAMIVGWGNDDSGRYPFIAVPIP
jgi:probable HAF family extracellular repeat protein